MDSTGHIRAPRGGQGLDQKELTAMPRRFKRNDNWDFGGKTAPAEEEAGEPKSRKRRLALTFVFTLVFFAGASFAAVAGSKFSASIQDDSAIESSTTTTDSSSEAAPAAEEAAPAADESAEAAPVEAAAPAAAPEVAAPADAGDADDSSAGTSDGGFTQVSKGSAATASGADASASSQHDSGRAASKKAD